MNDSNHTDDFKVQLDGEIEYNKNQIKETNRNFRTRSTKYTSKILKSRTERKQNKKKIEKKD